MAVQRSGNNLVYGLGSPLANLPPQNIFAKRAPTSSDSAEFGTIWVYVNAPTIQIYMLTYSSTWTQITTDGGTGTFSSLVVNGSAAINGSLAVSSSGGTIAFASGAGAINIGTDSVAKVITLGNTTGATSVVVNSGTGGITLSSNATGKISLVSQTATAAAFTITNDALVGTCTLTGQTLSMGSSQTITLNNSNITTSKPVMLNVSNLNVSTNGAYLTVDGVIQSTGSLAIRVTNNGAGALAAADTIIIGFIVLG